MLLRLLMSFGFLRASLGGSMATWTRLGAVVGHLGACWKPSCAILRYLAPSWRPSWDTLEAAAMGLELFPQLIAVMRERGVTPEHCRDYVSSLAT